VTAPPVIELSGLSKRYGALRPLRIERLLVGPAESVALIGFDQPAAEILVNLVTGATLPETGDARAFGRATSEIADSDEWLAFVDRFGIVSERAVLLDQLSVIQNIAVPFTLDIEPPPADVALRAATLAAEVGLDAAALHHPVHGLDRGGGGWARLRLARALALDPRVLLMEHLSAGVSRDQVPALGRHIRAIGARRSIALLTITGDVAFANAVADRVLTLEPATGRLRQPGPLEWIRGRLR
jgi:ABC-type transporter Mla maintaining outer membrane lipid asymmetry ATPase subunit MlaF